MIKNFILLAGLLTSATGFAQKIPATLTFKDGKVVNGYADPISQVNKKNEIAFKETSNGDKKMTPIESLSKIEYKDGDKTAIAEAIPVAEYGNKNKWFYKIYDGKLKVYVFTTSDTESHWNSGNYFSNVTNNSIYAFKYKDEPANIVTSIMDAGPLTINTFQKKGNLKALLKYFKDKCPKVNEAYEKGEIEFKKNPFTFVEYFEKNCNQILITKHKKAEQCQN